MTKEEHIINASGCAKDFIDSVNNKKLETPIELTNLLLGVELSNKDLSVARKVMALASRMFIDAISLYLIENGYKIVKEEK